MNERLIADRVWAAGAILTNSPVDKLKAASRGPGYINATKVACYKLIYDLCNQSQSKTARALGLPRDRLGHASSSRSAKYKPIVRDLIEILSYANTLDNSPKNTSDVLSSAFN